MNVNMALLENNTPKSCLKPMLSVHLLMYNRNISGRIFFFLFLFLNTNTYRKGCRKLPLMGTQLIKKELRLTCPKSAKAHP